MTRYWGKLRAGCAVASFLTALPSLADTYTVSTGQTQTQANAITDTGGAANTVTVTGGGTEIFTSTSNTYTGGTVINTNSTLQVGADTNLGGASYGVTLGDSSTGGILDLTTSTAAVASTRTFVLNGGGGTILAGTNAWTLSGVISGSGVLNVGGGGTLILAGSNTYTAATNVIGGTTLEVAADTSLGSSTSVLNLGNANTTGTLDLTNSSAISTTRAVILGAAGGTIDTGTSTWTLTNAVTGTGGLTVGGTGTLILDGANTYLGATTLNAGTLEIGDASTTAASLASNVTVTGGTLSGHGSVSGTVVNSGGTVQPGDGTTAGNLTVGNYTQTSGGTLLITVTPTTASELVVNGAATLDGTLKLAASGNFKSTTIQLIGANSLIGSFATKPVMISAGLDQTIVYDYSKNTVDLTLTQRSTLLDDNPSVYSALKSVAIDDAHTANDTILSHLTDTRAGAVVDGMRIVSSENHRAGSGAGGSPYGAWAKGLGSFGSTSGSGSAPGYDQSGGGFIAGVDTQLSPGIVAGIALGYTRNSVSESGGATGNVNTPRLMMYGGWWVGPVAFDATAGYGYANMTSTRTITDTGASATSAFGGSELTAAFQGSSNFNLGAVVLTPAAGVQYTYFRQNTFSESGGGAYNVNGLRSQTNSLRPFVAASASTRFLVGLRTIIEPTVRVMYEDEALGNSRQVAVQATGDDATFAYNGVTPSRNRVTATAGITVETTRNLAFFTEASLVEAGNVSGTKVDIGARYRF